MRVSELELKAKDFLDYELHDGYGNAGGTSSAHETVGDFIEDNVGIECGFWIDTDVYKRLTYEEALELDMYQLNTNLVELGIEPVPYNFEHERQCLACLIAFYVGERTNGFDSMAVMDACIKKAACHDFKLDDDELKRGNYFIDSQHTRDSAIDYADEIAKNLETEFEL